MERWKRNVLGLLLISALVYGAYLLWLYEASGGTMTVSVEMPEWTFPILVGAFIFTIGFGGGVIGMALDNPDFLREGSSTPQLLLLSTLIALLSAIVAFNMTGYLSSIQTAILVGFIIVAFALVAKRKKEKLTPKTVITDEREREIDIRSRALAGDTLVVVISVLLLSAIFDESLRPSLRTLAFYLSSIYVLVWLGARLYYRRAM